jgi:two-component system, cell cycle sensor histidine kinase and response regulator CckA
MCGYSAEELTGKKFTDLTHPDDIAKTLQSYEQLGSNKVQSYEMEKRYIHKDGKTIWVRVLASRINEETNIGIIEDITERKKAQQALAESEERLRTIVELAPDGIFVLSEQGKVLLVNQAACDQLGYTRSQLLQLTIFDFIAPRYAQRVANRLKGDVPSGSYDSAHMRSDGVEVPVELSVTRIVFRGNPAFLGITRDTSDRKRAEEQREKLEQQLRQSHKMEAVGRLAGGIAHDFNNLLMVIQSYAEILQESLPARDIRRKNTQEIMKAADRAAGLTRQMLAFSRKQILSPVVLDLNSVIGETAKMLRRVIGEDIDFHVIPAESLWPIMADSDQIMQVVMNLCVNARDAMPQGGTLTVATGNVTVGEGDAVKPEYVLPGDYVTLSVTDTGAGIDKELQAQVFEPFYTTKEVGKGTGLGLSTVYGIVKQSGGYVWVDSELGQGACFTVYLPRIQQAVANVMSEEAETPSRGNETLLVAEDEEALREAVSDYLSSLGYTVLAAGSGLEALSAASQHEGHIDLLITDLVMPKMSGRELSQMLGTLRPDLKTIYMSGYSDDAILRHGVQEMGATFLQKPFSLGTIARKVRETLGPSKALQ